MIFVSEMILMQSFRCLLLLADSRRGGNAYQHNRIAIIINADGRYYWRSQKIKLIHICIS